MATTELDLATYLIGAAAVNAYVAGRVYPNKAPAGVTYPCVTYLQVSERPIRSMGGSSGMKHKRFQVNCWDKSYKTAKELSEAVRATLDNFVGQMGATYVEALFLLDAADILDEKLGIDEDIPYGVRMDFQVRHRT